MLLFVVLSIAFVALVTLVAAILFGSPLLGWITVGASAAGLLLLLLNELRRTAPHDGEQDAAVSPPPPPQADIDDSSHEEPSVAAELADDADQLHPEIWPPEHPVQQTRSDDDRVEPRRVSEGDAPRPRPDIWP